MAVELLPSVLATTKTKALSRAAVAQRLSRAVHLDLMDGRFVSSRSVSFSTLARIPWTSKVEIHAMINNPVLLLPIITTIKPRRVYLHVELGQKLWPFIAWLRSRKIEFGIAINPRTSLSALKPFIPTAKSILVMSVIPGRYHAPLHPQAMNRIRLLHKRWPRVSIVADGSMNADTIPQAIQAGAKRIIVGSAVMLSTNPRAEWKKLTSLTKE